MDGFYASSDHFCLSVSESGLAQTLLRGLALAIICDPLLLATGSGSHVTSSEGLSHMLSVKVPTAPFSVTAIYFISFRGFIPEL